MMSLIEALTEQRKAEPSGRYVRWGKVWHGRDSLNSYRTYCGRTVPYYGATYQREQPSKTEACGRCFDV